MSAPKRIFVKGNEAIARGAIAAGAKCFFGYPITPQNDIPEFMSSAMIEAGGDFVQAESEVAGGDLALPFVGRRLQRLLGRLQIVFPQ